jgi:hypothetical protein
MQALPSTKTDWIGFALMPFKTFAIIACAFFPWLQLYCEGDYGLKVAMDMESFTAWMFFGCVLSWVVLILGVFIQCRLCNWKAIFHTFFFIALVPLYALISIIL